MPNRHGDVNGGRSWRGATVVLPVLALACGDGPVSPAELIGGPPAVAVILTPEPHEFRDRIHVVAPDGSDPIKVSDRWGVYRYAWNPATGGFAVVRSQTTHGFELWNARGELQRIVSTEASSFSIRHFRWSPDGRRLAFQRIGHPEPGIYVMERDGTGIRQIVPDHHADAEPAWSPDGRTLAFVRDTNAVVSRLLYLVDVDGGNDLRRIELPVITLRPAWSPDGRRIAFDDDERLWVVNADGTDLRQVASRCETSCAVEDYLQIPRWSPDGTRLSAVWGRRTVIIISVDGSDVMEVPPPGGNAMPDPFWSPDGSELVFSDGEGTYVVARDGTGLRRIADGGLHPRWIRLVD